MAYVILSTIVERGHLLVREKYSHNNVLGHHFSTSESTYVWIRIIDECPVPEIRIWSVLFITSD